MNRLIDSLKKLVLSFTNSFNHAVIWEYKIAAVNGNTIDAIPTSSNCPFPPISGLLIRSVFCNIIPVVDQICLVTFINLDPKKPFIIALDENKPKEVNIKATTTLNLDSDNTINIGNNSSTVNINSSNSMNIDSDSSMKIAKSSSSITIGSGSDITYTSPIGRVIRYGDTIIFSGAGPMVPGSPYIATVIAPTPISKVKA